MNSWINMIGWIGSLALIAAYFSLSRNWLSAQAFTYHLLNLIGSAALVVYTIEVGAYPSTMVNIIWLLIGLFSLNHIHIKTLEETTKMSIKKISLNEKLDLFKDLWSPKIIGRLNKQLVKVAKFKGDFTRHKHDDEDELFYVINGQLFIELEHETLEINAGEFVIIPRGIFHKPYAPKEAHVLLFEPETTLNTGDQKNQLTVDDLQEL